MPRAPRCLIAFALLCLVAPPAVIAGAEEPPRFEVTELEAEHTGHLAHLVDGGLAEPLSVATADFDSDGMPDLVIGYADGAQGMIALYLGNLEAVYPTPGEPAGEPFLPVSRVFEVAQRPDVVGAGDFDSDGRFDVVVGSLGGTTLALHRGDGRGGLADAERVELGGRLTAMAVGEVNRRDGLADVVAAVDGPSGPRIAVFEGPGGALRGRPELIDAPGKVTGIALGSLDGDAFRDIVAETGDRLMVVTGRDRRLSLGERPRLAVEPAEVSIVPAAAGAEAQLKSRAGQGGPPPTDLEGTVVDHLEMRLNRDAIPDSVAVVEGQPSPIVIKSRSRGTFTVDSTADDPDFSTADGVCDTDDSMGDGPCTLRAAIQQANASAGADTIDFDIPGSGPHTIQPLTQLPTVSEPLTIDATTEPDFAGTPVVELDGSAASAPLNGLVITGGSSVVRGLVINRMQRSSNIYQGSAIFLDGSGGNIIEGNFLGTDPSGTGLLSNEFYGVFGFSGTGNVYGGTVADARNVISGQFLNLAHREGTGVLIQGNYIGTDVTGTVALNSGSDTGIDLWSNAAWGGAFGGDHTIGGTTAGAGNLISGQHIGVRLRDGTSGNLVQGNLVGTDVTGTLPLPCSYRCVDTWGDQSDTIGGTSPGSGNVISVSPATYNMAIAIQESPDLLVQGNLIGVDVTGTSVLPCDNGVYIVLDSTGTTIGGAVAGAGNVIAGCTQHGVWLNNPGQVSVQGNFIGVDAVGAPLGNGLTGIGVYQGDTVTIGGAAPGEGNTIAHNGGSGVAVGEAGLECGPGISVVGNSIHSNAELGIDLESDGVTANDLGDGDTGSNGWQNFPVITAVTSGGGVVEGTLNSLPSTDYELAFYSSSACDPSGHGEGELFLGTGLVTTDSAGDASFAAPVATAVGVGAFVTATATDPDGSTSELSACFEYRLSADLAIVKDDGVTHVLPGDQVTYTIVASNAGPEDVPGAVVNDPFHEDLSCSWTCVAAGGATCTPGPSVDPIEDTVDLPVGGTATYTAVCAVDHTAMGTLENTAWVVAPTGVVDPNGVNDSATDVDTLLALDYGDAPDPAYPTLWHSDGARHVLGGGLFLGAAVDGEPDGQPTAGADGDDLDGSDDEDGVVFTSPLQVGFDATLDVTASAAGLLNAWLDLNADGDWNDPGEQVFADTAVATGVNNLVIPVPLDASVGSTYARFRLDSAGGLAPTGLAADGEVEDHAVTIEPSAEVSVSVADSPDPAVEGGPLTYFVAVANNGALDATGVALTDTLPAGAVFSGVTPGAPTCSHAAGVVSCDLGTLAGGAATQVVVTVDLPYGTVGTLTSTAVVALDQSDPVPANNTELESTLVVADADHVFSDGFESGLSDRWSDTVP